jgi:site-specific DNA-methyltransferase (adenine-specific)
MVKHSALFSSASVEWGTPPDLYHALDNEFHFTFDPCRQGGLWDGTYISWEGERVFCNPPYGRGVEKWLAKGSEAELAVFLLPARTDTLWFHEYALKADEIRFFRGRLMFLRNHIICPTDHKTACAPFPSMLVVYGK